MARRLVFLWFGAYVLDYEDWIVILDGAWACNDTHHAVL